MADTLFSALTARNYILNTYSFVMVDAAGVPYRYTGSMIAIDAAGKATLPGAVEIPANKLVTIGGAPVFAGNGGTLNYLYAGSGGLVFRNAGDTATIGTLDNFGSLSLPSGNLLVGVATGSSHTFAKNTVQGGSVLTVYGNDASFPTAAFYSVAGWGVSGAASALSVGRNTATGRGISSGGSINGNGADYAERMFREAGCGPFLAGDMAGVTSAGELTRDWSRAHSLVVISSEASFIGNDQLLLGLDGDELAAAEARIEIVAFCGQVPVNVADAVRAEVEKALRMRTPIYLVAQDGEVEAVPEFSMTLARYMRRLGKVWAMDEEGRPIIDVQHG